MISSLHSCPPLETIPPHARSEADHSSVVDWFHVHATKFVFSLAPEPVQRTEHLEVLARHARLFVCEPGQIVCLQEETCDTVFLVFSGSVNIYFDPTIGNTDNNVRRSQRADLGRKFATLGVGDYFGEPDPQDPNSVYPFTAQAESYHSMEADMLLTTAQTQTPRMSRMTSGKAPKLSTFRDGRSAAEANMRSEHEHNHTPRVIAIPAKACLNLTAQTKAMGGGKGTKKMFGLWEKAKLLESSFCINTLGRSSLYMLAMKSEERIYTNGDTVMKKDEKLSDCLNFILEGEVNFSLVSETTKARTTLMLMSTLGMFGDFATIVRETEQKVKEIKKDRGEDSSGEKEEESLVATSKATRRERRTMNANAFKASKTIGEQIDEVNSMVVIRDLGGASVVLPGQITADVGSRSVLSKYHVVASPSVRILSIPKTAFAEVATFSNQAAIDKCFEYFLNKVKKQCHWLETQQSLHSANKAGGTGSVIATGKVLWNQQAEFLPCDRCMKLKCHTLKPGCSKARLSKASSKKKGPAPADKGPAPADKGSGLQRMLLLKTADGDDFDPEQAALSSMRSSLKAAEGKAAERRASEGRKSKRRGSVEILLGLFKIGKGNQEEEEAAAGGKTPEQYARESFGTKDKLQKQLTIKEMSKARAARATAGKPKEARRGSIKSLAKNLFGMFD
ncbi:hypothetical protein TeGR_g8243 [Tetraparma gracilis]|uniref:Cyclic nucleotide-binding domain-containing protein n=1 Tax=Tetraparma gracilis TaxID=2962635 RepID=A0ABQ6M754_9STRA|nr:hypothetical protein TeGR_g8243 [Tetraparma gracilis]